MMDPAGRVAMISGAARGIGRAVVQRLLAAGYTVSAGVRDPSRLPAHPALAGHRFDAAEPGSADAWVAATIARHGRIDALVNAAGINPKARMLDVDEANFDAMWTVNAKGPMRVIRAAWPHLIAAGEGRVVNISSLSGKRVRNENLGYAMSKFAVMALTQEVRRQGWEHGIRATAVCPGFVDTDMTAHVTKVTRDAMSRPEDIAALIEAVLRLPNTATVAELLVNCRHEDTL
ncbi:SDR family NAD(P)-dependent oxidoreductase [Roseomonas sp. CECT 9278]|uniref:SDR family NAD(P)-dependent oxidoreductase n=1 Tax=Roseomonas sp. CECT 9278 TaxID=2845823 RepID=UPI001E5604E9|nr:SDR family NAD(P)-dependent oxidoreductase [Roseomonas sp. CECT 9278]CAH0264009.1 Oxidoreductase UcpA [Roseomonas sp. CECT 9278]